jgi:hypothetical protein
MALGCSFGHGLANAVEESGELLLAGADGSAVDEVGQLVAAFAKLVGLLPVLGVLTGTVLTGVVAGRWAG